MDRQKGSVPLRRGDAIPASRVRDAGADEGWTVYDFGAVYPVGEVRLTAKAGGTETGAHAGAIGQSGLKNVGEDGLQQTGKDAEGAAALRVEHSLNGKIWSCADEERIGANDGVGAADAFSASTGLAPAAAPSVPDAIPASSMAAAHSSIASHSSTTADSESAPDPSIVSPSSDEAHTASAVIAVADLGGVSARYVRIGGCGTAAEAVFFAGSGFAAEPADDWTQLFHRQEGWTGSDGIYSIPLNGVEAPGRSASARTLLLFGDTFIGSVDEMTDERKDYVMINNSYAILEGDQPTEEAIAFRWGKRDDGAPASAIVPATPRALAHEGAYYWLQDGTCVNGRFHCFPLIVGPNPEGPEGFEFAVHGIARVSAPMGEGGPELSLQEQADTALYAELPGGGTIYFGAAIVPLTTEAGASAPDGHVYIYGLRHEGGSTALVAARVPAEELAATDRWTFWDSSAWTGDMEACAPVVPEVSSELSVTPMMEGPLDGKFVIVFQRGGIKGNEVAVYTGDSPIGPFGPAVPVYACTEPDDEEGAGIYAYNAKAHPHLSAPGELLASYNVNTTSWDAHKQHGSIYRPRFIRIRQLV